MGMPPATYFWTPDSVRALPADGNRYEVIAGELFVTPAPTWSHQDAVAILVGVLRGYASTSLSWQPDPAAKPLVLDLTAFFREVVPEA